MISDMIICKCGYPRKIGEKCTACFLESHRPHVLVDTPANRAALEAVAVQLYNALGELQRQCIGAGTIEQRAAQKEAERALTAARVRAEACSVGNTVDLATACAAEAVSHEERRLRMHTPIVKKPYEALEADRKKR